MGKRNVIDDALMLISYAAVVGVIGSAFVLSVNAWPALFFAVVAMLSRLIIFIRARRAPRKQAELWYSPNDEDYSSQDPEDVLQELWDNREPGDSSRFTIWAGYATDIPFEGGDREGMFCMGKTWPVTFVAVDSRDTFPKWNQVIEGVIS